MPTSTVEKALPKPTKVALKEVAIVASIQPRERMSRDTVQKYTRLYRFSPGQLPPITLGRLAGRRKLVLIDGFHRIEAAREANLTHLLAYVYDTDEAGAMWLAASENTKHGLPLKGRERRKVFQRFVNAGLNRRDDGTLMSTRVLSETLGLGSHATMMNWMKQDFPRIAAEMRRRDPDEIDEAPEADQARQEDQLLQNVYWAEKEYLRTIAKALKTVRRDRVIWEVGNIANRVEATLSLPSGSLDETLSGIEEREFSGDY